MPRNHISSFILNGLDYFVANLVEGGVRVGMVGSDAFDFPAGHPRYALALALSDEAAAEEFFDECMSTVHTYRYVQ